MSLVKAFVYQEKRRSRRCNEVATPSRGYHGRRLYSCPRGNPYEDINGSSAVHLHGRHRRSARTQTARFYFAHRLTLARCPEQRHGGLWESVTQGEGHRLCRPYRSGST